MDAFTAFTVSVAEKGIRNYRAKVEMMIHYIHVHLHESITLEKAAEYAKLSSCYVSRIFKEETGVSFVEYIQKERVEAAKHMLIYSDFTQVTISEYLCFSTQSYFIKIFKRLEGMTLTKGSKVQLFIYAHDAQSGIEGVDIVLMHENEGNLKQDMVIHLYLE